MYEVSAADSGIVLFFMQLVSQHPSNELHEKNDNKPQTMKTWTN